MADPSPKTKPFSCRNCKHDFPHMQIVTLADIDNLVIGTAKVFRLEVVCATCGKVNYWNQRESEMTQQTEVFLQTLAVWYGGVSVPKKTE